MMQWGESIRFAWWALSVERTKAVLTMLGVMIGSASIVLVVTIASNGKAYVVSQIEGIGANLAYATLDRNATPPTLDDELSPEDLQAVKKALPMAEYAAGTYDIPVAFNLRGKVRHARLVGVTEEFQTIRNLIITSGRYFDAEDFITRNKVCMVTDKIAEGASGGGSVIGEIVSVDQFRCVVIGTFREGVPTFGQSEIQDETVLVPFPLVRIITGDNFFQVIYAQATSSEEVETMTASLKNLLQSRHRHEARYDVQNLGSVLETVQNVSLAMSGVLVAVAILTLITAGAGIMNIMLVNISQRMNEIGLRKALGARPAEIRTQFLMEAVFISLGGALGGVLVTVFLIWLADHLIAGPVAIAVSWLGVLAAFALSTGVGLLFGYRPASEAARLNPVEALRAEM